MSDGMLRAMDDVLSLSMLLKGSTSESMAAERQRREEKTSKVKVQQWMQKFRVSVRSFLQGAASRPERSFVVLRSHQGVVSSCF